MKKLIFIVVVIGLMVTGCSRAVANPIFTPLAADKPPTMVSLDEMQGFSTNQSVAVAPTVVEINNMSAGASADFQVLVHNGDGLKNKLLLITTEANETVAPIPLDVVLANSGLLDIVSIQSSLSGEYLEAISYDAVSKELTIKGFVPLAARIVKITYRTISSFECYYRYPSRTRAGYEYPPAEAWSWVTFDKGAIPLRPMENGGVLVSLKIPEDAKNVPPRWEFWVGVKEKIYGQVGQVATEIEYAPRILVAMK